MGGKERVEGGREGEGEYGGGRNEGGERVCKIDVVGVNISDGIHPGG